MFSFITFLIAVASLIVNIFTGSEFFLALAVVSAGVAFLSLMLPVPK